MTGVSADAHQTAAVARLLDMKATPGWIRPSTPS